MKKPMVVLRKYLDDRTHRSRQALSLRAVCANDAEAQLALRYGAEHGITITDLIAAAKSGRRPWLGFETPNRFTKTT